LRTGELRKHNPDDLITRIANVDYDPQADCPHWKKFIMEIMNYNAELIHFIQKAAGWAITGDTSEQAMFILFDTGANGKSTFLNTIMNLLGDYAIATPTETFMKKKGDHISNDTARLRGTRSTDEYRGEMDVIGIFLNERCIQNKDYSLRIREMYKAYADWCDENNEHSVSERFFTMRLKDLGFQQTRTAEARYWIGIQMKNEK
jgi:phage/plasmid-associated DNA primase